VTDKRYKDMIKCRNADKSW